MLDKVGFDSSFSERPRPVNPEAMLPISSANTIKTAFSHLGKHVITFAGFGELGYEDPTIVECVATEVLKPHDPASILVNTGTLLREGGLNGIADIYPIADRLGIETTGVHPSVALDYQDTHKVSPHCRRAWFVSDNTWGGFDDKGNLSPILRTTLEITDELVVIGGGKHAADELEAFIRSGKPVRYFSAKMNHRISTEWCKISGAHISDSWGDAHRVWTSFKNSSIR